MNKQYLSTAELARLLGVSRITVFQKIKKGEIKAEKIGRNFAIDKDILPMLLGQELTTQQKQTINEAVKGTVSEYGETLKLLGRE